MKNQNSISESMFCAYSPYNRSGARKTSGSSLVELPFVLWIMFILVLFPLVDMTILGIRTLFVYGAAHNACISAARARSFATEVDGNPTAQELAQSGAAQAAAVVNGVHIATVTPNIIITNIQTGSQTTVPGPLKITPDSSVNFYQIQVSVSGSVDPFLPVPFPVSVPGLNAPAQISFSDNQYFENPVGLAM